MTWPKVVPILTVADVREQPSLIVWLVQTFPGSNGYNEAYKELRSHCRMGFLKSVYHWNMHWGTSERMIANAWNKSMKKLGYTVPCDRE